MILNIFSSLCVLALTLLNVAFAKDGAKEFWTISNSFAGDLYRNIAEGYDGNLIISPVSVHSAMSLAMFGASGETKNEMLAGLKYPASYGEEKIKKNFAAFTEKVSKTNGLKIVNKIYVKKNFSLKRSFKDVATNSFGSEAQTLDFSQNTQSAATINGWVEEHTNNKIKNLIAPSSLNDNTRMVLVNAIYFKGLWANQFDPEDTFKAPFHLNDQETTQVDFMKIKEHFKYASLRDLAATAIQLPYNNSDISMLIILPNSPTGLSQLERKLTVESVGSIYERLESQEVNVEIPKFKIEFDMELNGPLTKMGLNRMFTDAAEFGNMLDENEKLKISNVIHKAFIEVNEEGAEAAAASVVAQFHNLPSLPPPNIFFKANRPFVFALTNRNTKTNFFLARLSKM